MIEPAVAISGLALGAAICVFVRRQAPVTLSALVWLVATLCVAALAAFAIANSMTGNGIDDSVVYHAWFGVRGAGLLDFVPQLLVGASALLLALALGARIMLGRPARAGRHTGRTSVATIALLLAALIANPGLRDIASLAAGRLLSHAEARLADPAASRLPPDDYVTPVLGVSGSHPDAPKRRNLVWLYMESLERTFLDETLFPGLTPNLLALSRRGVEFSDIRQVRGAGWSIAGEVASQCGIPLGTPDGFGNTRGGVDSFLPGAVCVGDLLASAGYELSYMQGADIEFAGADLFFRNHGFARVAGLDELEGRVGDPGYRSSWGLYDDTFLGLVRDEIRDLASAAQSRPYAVAALTLDTHPPDGHLAATCRGLIYGDGSEPMLNAVHCADRLIGAFVREILNDPSLGDPLIVLQSDHLMMGNSADHRLAASAVRRNFLTIIDPLAPAARSVDKPGSMLDAGATVLAAMGFDIAGIGFGRSLLGDKPTLVESHEDPGAYLATRYAFLRDLWSFPDLASGMSLDVVSRKIRLGARLLDFPALLQADPSLQIEDLFSSADSTRDLKDVIAGFDPETAFVWVDDCLSVYLYAAAAGMDIKPRPPRDCALLSSGKGGGQRLVELDQSNFLPAPMISATLFPDPAPSLTETARQQRIARTERIDQALAMRGVVPDFISLDPSIASGRLVVISGGGPRPDGSAAFAGLTEADRLGIDFRRGITLYGASVGPGVPSLTPLAALDTCGKSGDLLARYGGLDGLRRRLSLSAQPAEHDLFVLMVHDSAYCGERDILSEVQSIHGLAHLADIGFRAPYVAIMTRDRLLLERAGEQDEDLTAGLGAPPPWLNNR